MQKLYSSEFQTINGVRFHHLEWNGAEPPIVFLPGFISNAYAALRLGNHFYSKRRVLSFDLRGRGASDKPEGEYGFEQHLTDLDNRLNALEIETVILAGHSFGALLALVYAALHMDKVHRIVLFDGGAPPSPGAYDLFKDYHENLTYSYASVEAYVAPYRNLISLQPWTEEAETLTRANVTEQADGTATRTVPPYVVAAELAKLTRSDRSVLSDLYPHINIPVLLIRAGMGSFDENHPHIPDEVLATIKLPDLQVYDMPTAGHTSVLTIPDKGRDMALTSFIMGNSD